MTVGASSADSRSSRSGICDWGLESFASWPRSNERRRIIADSGKILLTGATGNVGSALLGYLGDVQALTHDESKAQSLEDQGIEVVIGDLSKPETLGLARLSRLVAEGRLHPKVSVKAPWTKRAERPESGASPYSGASLATPSLKPGKIRSCLGRRFVAAMCLLLD
jgi:hypothetical protein